MFISESWAPVVGFEGRYEVSCFGRIRTYCDPARSHPEQGDRILRLQKHSRGYLRVKLYRESGRVWRRVHRMVAESFIGLAPAKDYTVDHKDFDKTNNCWLNLEWITREENWRRWRERELENDDCPTPF